MNDYCTYFDRGYLAQGLALWRSLERHDADARLTVLALDGETAVVMREVGGPRVTVIELGQLLAVDAELADVKRDRSRSEFIFALTPCLVRHLFATGPDLTRLVYLDADLFFFGSARPIWDELGDHSGLIVPHRYPPWHDDAAWYGRFNVGVVGLRHDESGRACVDWWRERCLESTALAGDGSRFGDQKYLDEWPGRFAGVVESRHPGINVAPWNWARYRFLLSDGAIAVDGVPLVVFHFAQFRRIGERWFDSGQLEYGIMPRTLRSRLYGEYWMALVRAEREIQGVSPAFALVRRGWSAALGRWPLAGWRILWGQFWWRAGGQWFAGRLGLGRFSGRVMGRYRRWRRRRR